MNNKGMRWNKFQNSSKVIKTCGIAKNLDETRDDYLSMVEIQIDNVSENINEDRHNAFVYAI